MEKTVESLIPAIATWIVDRDGAVTKTKLLKLLYLFDVEFYRKHGRTFTGFSWKFFHLGPWAAEYDASLTALVARGVLAEQRSNSANYDTSFYRPGSRVEIESAVTTVADQSILRVVLKRWGTASTGEILDYVYFHTEPMESGVRNQPLDFSLIAAERTSVYSRSSSGKPTAEIRKLRAEYERRQTSKKIDTGQPFAFTPPKYDEEYFEAMAKLPTV